MDALGHINNCEYFRYSESARLRYFEELFGGGSSVFANGEGPILADIGCAFHEQVVYPAKLDIGVAITRVGRSSLDLVTPIFLAGQNLAVADVRAVLVWFDYAKQQPAPVPDILRQQVKSL
jgi:acyl-CoA thioester hydrolase